MKIRFLSSALCALAAPLAAQSTPDFSPRWSDYDRDGRLDAFVPGPEGGRLYRQAAPGRFEDVTVLTGLGQAGASLDASWHDVDEDGDVDLLLVGAMRARLFENTDGQFQDVSARAGLTVEGTVTRVAWQDLDGDGRLDLEVVQPGQAVLFRNLDGLAFERTALVLPTILEGASAREGDRGDRPGETTRPAAEAAGRDGRAPSRSQRTGAPLRPGDRVGAGGGTANSSGGPGFNASTTGGSSAAGGGLVWADRLIDQVDGASLIAASSLPVLGELLPLGSQLWLGAPSGDFLSFEYDDVSDTLNLLGELNGSLYGPYLSVLQGKGFVGIRETNPAAHLHVSGGSGGTELRIEADLLNTDETDHPTLTLVQDGGATTGTLGYVDGTNHLTLENSQGGIRVQVRSVGDLVVVDAAGEPTVALDPDDGLGGALRLRDENGELRVLLEAMEGSSGGNLEMNSAAGPVTVALDADVNGAGFFLMRDAAGHNTVLLEAAEGGNGGNFELRNAEGSITALIDADDGDNAVLRLFQEDGTNTFSLGASEGSTGANLLMRADSGQTTISLDADEGGAGDGALRFYNEAGLETAQLLGFDEGFDGAILRLRDETGTTRINLNAGTGVTTTQQLQITGGADIAEPFPTSSKGAGPGHLMSIDPERTGALVLSAEPYDRRVAGVVSGAGGIRPGLTLTQEGTIASGDLPVALTGRVWCWAEANSGAIRPGDRLVTSALAGHAMKATDAARTPGAVIGKAMSSLDEGTGLVLVLVNLQ